ncbi:hypothetical protein LX81_00569 [Palleronia aestuarii]|uniref:Uncharacterized protein n=1 Tax=Palleronia aestuarii TaxID=568105 RepID=A0A2W7P082_9RHOB|nr:hypothetical protein [Palleronia aestuarii]PZX18876.1 hypothetical protein LX81_00569 [Palleronia aestuarii]
MAQDSPFDGIWRANPTARCDYTGEDGGALKIEEDVLFGVENQCRMIEPVDVRGMDAILYDMVCEGPDPEWAVRAMLMPAADGGLILVWNGYAYKYEACSGTAMQGIVTTADEIGVAN